MKTDMQIACRYCHEGKMFQETYSETFKFGRSSLNVDGLVRWHCESCDSIMTKPSQIEHNSELIDAAKLNSPSFVSLGMLREFRLKYNLSQRDASKLIGAGEGAFGKYESGENISVPTAKLIRMALACPEVVRLLAIEANMNIRFDEVNQSSSDQRDNWTGGKFPYLRLVSGHARSECMNDHSSPSLDVIPANLNWKSSMVKYACS